MPDSRRTPSRAIKKGTHPSPTFISCRPIAGSEFRSFVYRQDGFELSFIKFSKSLPRTSCKSLNRLRAGSKAFICFSRIFSHLRHIANCMRILYLTNQHLCNTSRKIMTNNAMQDQRIIYVNILLQSPKSMTLMAIVGQTLVHSAQLSHLS